MSRVLLLTGNQLRHQYVANRLSERVNLVGIVSEAKAAGNPGESGDEAIALHFQQRSLVEEEMLAGNAHFPSLPLREIENGTVNSADTYQWIGDLKPDVIVLYGTGIIKQPLIDMLPGAMINMHLGLSPWYRGAGTNFWPFVYEQPECVGATIHLVAAKVDAGVIFGQVRPEWSPNDGIHEAGTKTIMAGAEELSNVVQSLGSGALRGVTQDLKTGKVFRQSDFTSASLHCAWNNLRAGMVEKYIAEAAARNQKYSIVSSLKSPSEAVA